ncbi:uncharacterized protein LOC119135790 [Syngnathus acus]|uniref:uncharacterized protein LOC119135790 n=1 Tax=Syngnathus acus TaxID=161584 RepID=UPI0018863634|nr:uncharacterized protein LOC119135790 [Syngnathus acus]
MWQLRLTSASWLVSSPAQLPSSLLVLDLRYWMVTRSSQQQLRLVKSLRLRWCVKHQGWRSLVAESVGHAGRLLCIHDSVSGRRFLCDTGAQRSLLPVDVVADTHGPPMEAADGSPIRTSLHIALSNADNKAAAVLALSGQSGIVKDAIEELEQVRAARRQGDQAARAPPSEREGGHDGEEPRVNQDAYWSVRDRHVVAACQGMMKVTAGCLRKTMAAHQGNQPRVRVQTEQRTNTHAHTPPIYLEEYLPSHAHIWEGYICYCLECNNTQAWQQHSSDKEKCFSLDRFLVFTRLVVIKDYSMNTGPRLARSQPNGLCTGVKKQADIWVCLGTLPDASGSIHLTSFARKQNSALSSCRLPVCHPQTRSSHICGEAELTWLEFLDQAVDHNPQKAKDLLWLDS